MDIISYGLASEAQTKANQMQTELNNYKNEQKVQQITKLGVNATADAPYRTTITINDTSEFKRLPIEVLQLNGTPGVGDGNIITTISSFSNTDSTDFNADSSVVFDGSLHLKSNYNIPTTNSIVGSGSVYSGDITKSDYANIETINVTNSQKILVEENGILKTHRDASTIVIHDFNNEDLNDFQANNNIVFDGKGKLKTSYNQQMVHDATFIENGTLLKTAIDKNSFTSIEKLEVY